MIRIWALAVVVMLSACGGQAPQDTSPGTASFRSEGREPLGLAGLFSRPRAEDPAPTRPRLPTPLSKVQLAAGNLLVAPPKGYCIDPTTIRKRGVGSFALIASCRILTGGRGGEPVAPMIVTVTVGPRAGGTPSPKDIAEAAGSALLSGQNRNGLVTAHLASGGQAGLAGGDTRYWRATFLEGGRLVGLALYAPKGSRLAAETGGAMLARVRQSITATKPQEAPAQTPNLLGRLFQGKTEP